MSNTQSIQFRSGSERTHNPEFLHIRLGFLPLNWYKIHLQKGATHSRHSASRPYDMKGDGLQCRLQCLQLLHNVVLLLGMVLDIHLIPVFPNNRRNLKKHNYRTHRLSTYLLPSWFLSKLNFFNPILKLLQNPCLTFLF